MTFIPSFLSVSIRFPSGASTSSLTLLLVFRFRCGFDGFPPITIVGIPPNGVFQTTLEICMARLPPKLGLKLGGVDCIATIMSGTIFDVVEIIGGLAHDFKNVLQHGDIVPLAIGADKIGFSQDALGEDGPHSG